jgi:hypothetical protein
MSEIIDVYSNEIKNIIEKHKGFRLYNNFKKVQLNWYGPIYAGIGYSLQECGDIFYKKLFYELKDNILEYSFNLEIIISLHTTKIRYIYNFKNKSVNRFTYDKIFSNKSFETPKKEIIVFNNRLCQLEKFKMFLPKYIWNRINNKYKFLIHNKDILIKIKNLILCNNNKFKFAPELIQNLILCLFNSYY